MSKSKDNVLKVRKKFRRAKTPTSKLVTNDTVAEHREKILAGGRKFKYPIQYSKHKVIINALIVVIIAMIGFGVWLVAMLYKAQSTDDFFYSVAKIVPLPVANVDGENVPYSDYLRRIRSAIFYKENQEKVDLNSADGKNEVSYLKRQELNKAEKLAYAAKIARERNITVSTEEVNDELQNNLKSSTGTTMSQEDYESNVLSQYFGWTIDDYKAEIRSSLLEKKVAFAVDAKAQDKINKIKKRLDAGEDFSAVAKDSSDDVITATNGGGVAAQDGDSDTNGLIAAARALKEGETSKIIQGVDGYYIVKLGSKKETTTNFYMIKVSLTQFDKDFSGLRGAGKIKEYINVLETDAKDS